MTLKVWCALFLVVALPFVFEATNGCGFRPDAVTVDANSYVCSCNCQPQQRHRDLRVSFSEDDVGQRLDSTIVTATPNLDFLNGRFVGIRFRNVGIPPGAGILHATVQFTALLTNAGSATVQIAGEAADNAPVFSTAAGSLGTLSVTASAIPWTLSNWTAGEAGPNELTPDLAAVLQEIINRPGWADGNALALRFAGTASTALLEAFSFDGQPQSAALLSIDYTEPSGNLVGPQDLQVCMPPAFNTNLTGGTTPTDADLTADCLNHVQPTLIGLAQACNYPSLCTCSFTADSQRYSGKCNDTCVENPLDPSCTNFDPKNGNVTATNAPGDQPVCLANSPLSSALFGRRTSCAVEGMSHITVSNGDDSASEDSHTTGIVQFVGDPCPGKPCAAGMEYRLDFTDVEVGNFFESATFNKLAGLGENLAGNKAVLSPTGDGTFGPQTLGASAQGRRDNNHLQGLVSTNDDPVDVNVGWGQSLPTCSVHGTLLGNVDPELKRCENAGPSANNICQSDADCIDDPACSDGVCNCVAEGTSDLTMSLDVTGTIFNQPPTANAGPDQDVECTAAAVTDVVLDASASTDPDSNIALYSWLRGGRAGKEVGFEEMSKVEQPLGSQTYVLRVIDALGQADEDTTVVNVIDTMPPVLSCVVGRPVLNQTNHDLINVGLMADAQDQCEGTLPVAVNVFGNEDDEENTGDGRFSPDAKDIAVGTLRLRAERKGNGAGRVYLVITEATDSSGNRGFNCCTVSVPLSSAPAALTAVRNQAAAAKAFCLANDGTAPAGYFVIGDGPIIGPKQ